ncbi:MAG: CBS domain-containing protein, partial [Candidatus Bathyarchaeia archaeon]
GDIMSRNVVTAKPNDDIRDVAAKLIEKGIDHLPVVDEVGKLIGIVTSWDLAKAIAYNKRRLDEIMTRRVITAFENESIDVVVRRMAQHNISGVPVVDAMNRVIGILTTDDISRKIVGGRNII